MKTLLQIFMEEPDDAEIVCTRNKFSQTVGDMKKSGIGTWNQLNDPVWTVKRKPRAWEGYGSATAGHLQIDKGPSLKSGERVKLVEVIEND